MCLQPFVPTAMCTYSHMRLQAYVPTAMCAYSHLSLQPYVPTAIRAYSDMYVPTTICAYSYLCLQPCSAELNMFGEDLEGHFGTSLGVLSRNLFISSSSMA